MSGAGKIAKKISERQRVRDTMLRTEMIDHNLRGAFVRIDQRMNGFAEVLSALMELTGVSQAQLDEKILDMRRTAAREALEKAIAEGTAAPVDKIGPGALVVHRVLDKDGAVTEARGQVMFEDLKYQDRYLDAAVGAIVEVDDGAKIEVLEIYKNPSCSDRRRSALMNPGKKKVDGELPIKTCVWFESAGRGGDWVVVVGKTQGDRVIARDILEPPAPKQFAAITLKRAVMQLITKGAL